MTMKTYVLHSEGDEGGLALLDGIVAEYDTGTHDVPAGDLMVYSSSGEALYVTGAQDDQVWQRAVDLRADFVAVLPQARGWLQDRLGGVA